jgi:hypothetical protein
VKSNAAFLASAHRHLSHLSHLSPSTAALTFVPPVNPAVALVAVEPVASVVIMLVVVAWGTSAGKFLVSHFAPLFEFSLDRIMYLRGTSALNEVNEHEHIRFHCGSIALGGS